MPVHGARGKELESTTAPFRCRQCGRQVERGDLVVGFYNADSAHHWEHVCAGACADVYRVVPRRITSTTLAVRSAVSNVISGAVALLPGLSTSTRCAQPASYKTKTAALGVDESEADRVLVEFGGDEVAALAAVAERWLQESFQEMSPPLLEPPAGGTGRGEACGASSDEELPPSPAEFEVFSSNDARAAACDVFISYIKPLLPKPQGDGSFKDGDAELLDSLMVTPIELALPRAERLSDLVKPEAGWDDASLRRSRDFFALAAAGVRYILYLPVITHRQQLARSSLFALKDADGNTIGVRDCCPHCRSNAFVNVTEGSYNITKTADTSRNGVRFLYSNQGSLVPVSRSVVCRSPSCSANLAKLQTRQLAAPSLEKALPATAKAPDGKPWPETKFSTHSTEYISLIAEACPALGYMFIQNHIFTEGGCDASLAARLMQSESTISAVCKEVQLEAKVLSAPARIDPLIESNRI